MGKVEEVFWKCLNCRGVECKMCMEFYLEIESFNILEVLL